MFTRAWTQAFLSITLQLLRFCYQGSVVTTKKDSTCLWFICQGFSKITQTIFPTKNRWLRCFHTSLRTSAYINETMKLHLCRCLSFYGSASFAARSYSFTSGAKVYQRLSYLSSNSPNSVLPYHGSNQQRIHFIWQDLLFSKRSTSF